MKNRTRSTRRSWQTALIFSVAALPLQSVVVQPALAQGQYDTIRVTLNGRAINFGPVAPTQQSGRVLVPLRGVFEALGAFVEYNNATQSITATRGETRVQLTIGSARAYVNGQSRTLDVPAQVQSGRTLVPLRFVSEALGATVLWNDAQRTVLITTSDSVGGGNAGGNAGGNGNIGNNGDDGNDNGNTVPVVNNVSGTIALVDDSAPGAITIRVLDANTTAADPPRNLRYSFASNARLFRRTTGRLVRGQAPVYDAAIALGSPLTRLSVGEDVALQLNASGQVSRVTSSVSLVAARIRDVQNDQVILDDTPGTTLTVGPSLRVVDERGRQSSSASALSPGQQVVLFIAPSTRRVFKVSALSTDLTLAENAGSGSGNVDDNGDDNTLPEEGTGTGSASGTPQINLVQHNATRPLRAGQTLSVTVRGTPGQRATFGVLPDVPELPMTEDPNRPGVYTGTYVVQSGDSVLNGRVSATLRNNAGRESFRQSQNSVTIDTVAPRITSISPASGSTISSSQSNVVINATDVGGSGLGSATVSFNGQNVATEDITVSSNSVSVIAPDSLNGQVSVVVSVSDRAGNQARRTFSYFVDENGGGTGNDDNNSGNGIISLTHNATRDMQPGDRVTVNLRAAAGGTATFDVRGSDNSVLVRNVRMTETADGRYRGTFSIPAGDESQLTIRGRFTDANGRVSTEEATAPIILSGNGNGNGNGNGSGSGTDDGNDNGNDVNGSQSPLTISAPGDGATVGRTLTVRGAAEPDATIEVSVLAQGTRYLIFEYSNDLGTQQVQANSRGTWTTNAINLPTPANVSNLKYVITATQTNGANRRSEPVTITVTPRGSGSSGGGSSGGSSSGGGNNGSASNDNDSD